jgi:hypothetical protein
MLHVTSLLLAEMSFTQFTEEHKHSGSNYDSDETRFPIQFSALEDKCSGT